MHDPRNDQLADVIVNHSLKLKAGEKVLIRGSGFVADHLIRALIRAVKAAGAHPVYKIDNEKTLREWLKQIDSATLDLAAKADAYQMRLMDAYVGFIAPENALELSDLSREILTLYHERYYDPVHMKIRLTQTRWVVLRYPTDALAQSARMTGG